MKREKRGMEIDGERWSEVERDGKSRKEMEKMESDGERWGEMERD